MVKVVVALVIAVVVKLFEEMETSELITFEVLTISVVVAFFPLLCHVVSNCRSALFTASL